MHPDNKELMKSCIQSLDNISMASSENASIAIDEGGKELLELVMGLDPSQLRKKPDQLDGSVSMCLRATPYFVDSPFPCRGSPLQLRDPVSPCALLSHSLSLILSSSP